MNPDPSGAPISLPHRLWRSIRTPAFLGIAITAVCLAQGSNYFPPADAAGGWRTLKDPAEIRQLTALDFSRLEDAFEFTQRCTQNGGLLVVRHGYLVFERYFGRAHRNANPDMASTGKAYTSIACGIML